MRISAQPERRVGPLQTRVVKRKQRTETEQEAFDSNALIIQTKTRVWRNLGASQNNVDAWIAPCIRMNLYVGFIFTQQASSFDFQK